MKQQPTTLHMICGKIASGKSTLATELGRRPGTIVISEDDWLNALYADELKSISDYVRCAAKLRKIIGPHVASVLKAGVSVVLDFQANTIDARAWMRSILDQTETSHVLHILNVPDNVCLERLRVRNAQAEHPFVVTEEQFHQTSSHFAVPASHEKFNVVLHQ